MIFIDENAFVKVIWKCLPFGSGLSVLTHCGLVMPYGDKHLGEHWFR